MPRHVSPYNSWIHSALKIPSQQQDRRLFYPWSDAFSKVYRLKLAFIMANVSLALLLAEKPCDRMVIPFICWLVFITCDYVLKAYPWREKASTLMWRFFCFLPWMKIAVFLLTLVAFFTLTRHCSPDSRTLAAFMVWITAAWAWQWVRDAWGPPLQMEDDYRLFSRMRPFSVMNFTWLEQLLWIFVTGPQYPAFYGVSFFSMVLFVEFTMLLKATSDAQVIFYSILICSFTAMTIFLLYKLGQQATEQCDKDERIFGYSIAKELKLAKEEVEDTKGKWRNNPRLFPRVATKIPLLLREADILLTKGRLPKWLKTQLDQLRHDVQIKAIQEHLNSYGIATDQCCIS